MEIIKIGGTSDLLIIHEHDCVTHDIAIVLRHNIPGTIQLNTMH